MAAERTTPALGIVVALAIEARAFNRRVRSPGHPLEVSPGIFLMIGGIGAERASHAAEQLVARGVEALVSWGIAGGLHPELVPGTLLLPRDIIGHCGEAFACDPHWRDQLRARLRGIVPLHEGELLESRTIVSSAEAKAMLFARSKAVAIDMESAAVARVARRADKPFVAIRALADPASEGLPGAARAATSRNGELRLGGLMGAVIRRPGELTALVRLARHTHAAQSALRAVVRQAGQHLMAPGAADCA